jgi:D-psicose/D-tagatose/L-ribulose 3-epimerase
MKIGVNAFLWTASFTVDHLPLIGKIKEGGADGIELVSFDFANFPAAAVREELARTGSEATFCTALTGQQSLASDDSATRKATSAYLRDAIKVTAESGAKILAGPFCSAVGYLPGRRRTDDEWKHTVEGLQSLRETLDHYDVTLAVEPLNRFETYFLNTAADAAKLCDEVGHPRIGILYDTFHANIEEKNQGNAIRTVGRHLKHMHTCENDRGTPGSGSIAWDEVFQALKDVGYDGWLTIESFGSQVKEIAKAACIWRDLAPSVETIAFEGTKFLRSKLGTK